ncbi:MAG: hypothetical protein KDA93_24340 [Planctomycetaceae bacterium]|nr:hypothetical protein [Planctomycetaceae bacterium]
MDTTLDQLSGRVHAYLTSQGIQQVRMGTFAGPPTSGAGVALRTELKSRLESTGLTVTKRAMTELRGEFSAKVNAGEPPAVSLHAKLYDHRRHEMVDFRYRPDDIEDVDSVAQLLSPTVDLTVKRSNSESPSRAEEFRERDQRLVESIIDPTFHQTTNSIMAATSDSPYRMEVLLRKESRLTPVPLEDFLGQAFVDLPPGVEYVVRVYNDSDIDVGVQLMIDGVNSLELSQNEAYRELGLWMIGAHSHGTIDGWHLTNTRSLAFLIADIADSEAARLERDQSEIGTISAAFYPAWMGDNKPEVEILGKTRNAFGTAAGDEVQSEYKETKRHFGQTLLTTLSMRYEKPEVTNETLTADAK